MWNQAKLNSIMQFIQLLLFLVKIVWKTLEFQIVKKFKFEGPWVKL